MPPDSLATDRGRIWFHPDRVDAPSDDLFDPEAWRRRARVAPVDGTGRGAAWFIDTDRRGLVLRGYRRGGLVGRLIHDWYLFTGERRTRPAREWHILRFLEKRELPAPRPVAARYRRNGLTYSADMLTERLENTRALSARLTRSSLPAAQWRDIGHTIRVFHNAGVCHADLNAHNILLDEEGQVYLIDFDRARRRRPGPWRRANLERLLRSLRKLAAERVPFHFGEADWRQLLAGYGGDA